MQSTGFTEHTVIFFSRLLDLNGNNGISGWQGLNGNIEMPETV